MSTPILVVDDDPSSLADTIESLKGTGSEITAARSFADGKRAMDESPPALLITAVRLGAFNGLHLVIRGLARQAQLAAIVVGEESDRGLTAEVEQLGASFVVRPLTRDRLLSLVARALPAEIG
jgi:DNA-binding NtrC family response regulator